MASQTWWNLCCFMSFDPHKIFNDTCASYDALCQCVCVCVGGGGGGGGGVWLVWLLHMPGFPGSSLGSGGWGLRCQELMRSSFYFILFIYLFLYFILFIFSYFFFFPWFTRFQSVHKHICIYPFGHIHIYIFRFTFLCGSFVVSSLAYLVC